MTATSDLAISRDLPRPPLPRTNLRITATDGTLLAIDVHLPPQATWPVPVVVTRTPYGRSQHLAEGRGWQARGYGYVVADVRGRYDSDGTWQPYTHERADSAAVADWITAQPWCDGRLIAYGGSYSGYTAWTLAVERPRAVAAVVSMGPSMSLTRTKREPSGVLRLAEHAAWWLERAEARTSRDGLARQVFAEQPDLLYHLPIVEIGGLLNASLEQWADLVTSGDAGEHLTDVELQQVASPALHIGGWYDLLLPETLDHWRTVGSAHQPRPHRRMVVGPWGHDLAFSETTAVGAREHGPAARMRFNKLCLDWIDAVLSGTPPADQAEIFVVGENAWHTVPDFVSVPTRTTTLTTPTAEALVDATVRGGEPAGPAGGLATFRYDPANPFPSRRPSADRADTRERDDAVRFTSTALEAPCTIWGAAEVDLVAGVEVPAGPDNCAVDPDASAAGADWIVRLMEQRVDGVLIEIARGTAVDHAGACQERTVRLGPTALTIPAGSRLVLEITASDFPDLARNLGTHQDRYHSTAVIARNHQVHWGEAGTRVRLPLLVSEQP